METILAAVLPAAVTGGLALVGVILSNLMILRRYFHLYGHFSLHWNHQGLS